MKKTTNSNPLKYFNDAAAAKAKSVNAGNDKLIKAQFEIAGNPSFNTFNTADKFNIKMQKDSYAKKIKERDLKYNQQMSESAERRKNNTSATPAPIPTPAPKPYTPSPYKKGGSTKSKKK